ncbi:ig-like domain-containing protein [Caerostris darwini]|uniref:Ig-like domain-containing protein n=1 Tax=Caerostris darwini TaxID=1538125 RepID=A0AAV4N653_9ARAC|nr:ig-like domain-containing protein [Caerostris darwini]
MGHHRELQKSVQGHVYLTKTDLDTEGVYRCEASAESPTFQTVEAEKHLKVFVIPQEDPEIIGSQSRYEVGDYVNVTCKSGPSKPAAVLKWYINGKEAAPGLEISYPTIDHANGLQTSLLGLWFMVKPKDLFQGGAITLKCTATVSQTYSTSSEELIVGEKFVGTVPIMNTLTVITKDGPLITGGESQYRVGEILNFNCSSTKSRPAPTLHWYLNEELVDDHSVIQYPTTLYPDGEEVSVLGLRLKVQPAHLDSNEEVRLKCTATLSRVINVRSDERTVGGNHRNSGLQVAENYGKVSERNRSSSKLSACFIVQVAVLFTIVAFL